MNQPYNFISPGLKNFDPHAYHYFGLWKQKLFSEFSWVTCYNSEVVRKFGIESREAGSLILCDGNFFLKKTEIENIKRQIFEKINSKDEAFFKNLVVVADEYFKKGIEYAESLKDKDVTPENFEEYLNEARKINFIWMLGAEQFSEAAEANLQEAVSATSFPASKVGDIIPKVITPLYYQHKEMLELKKLVGNQTLEQVKATSDLIAKLETHAKKYPWIEIANFEGNPLTVERLYEQMMHAQEEGGTEQTLDIPVPEELAFKAWCFSQCGYVRQAAAEHFFMLSEKVLPILKNIAKLLGLTYQELLMLRETEILEGLKGTISGSDLKNRSARRENGNYVWFCNERNESIFSEESSDIELLKKEMLPQADTKVVRIEGQTGNRGTYTGPVKIVLNTHDFHKIQAGDVLVSTMTTPDFVVVMQKAGAIVTDIGGMLCHAAIVSREINKPCLIGTKIATKTFKDGDVVEVDAEKGIVRKLS